MNASRNSRRDAGFQVSEQSRQRAQAVDNDVPTKPLSGMILATLNGWIDVIAPCPWSAHIGLSGMGTHMGWSDQATLRIDLSQRAPTRAQARAASFSPLYSPEERQRRDATPWTVVQGILAPIQFLAFAVSLALIIRYMATGQGYGVATVSILIKTALLYAIMITGSIWEKVVFGKWLFAKAFFWEDVFSMLVLGLQTTYLVTLLLGWGTAAQQMLIAVAAYAAYAINASQFLLKLRAARLEAPGLSCVAA
jgi:3-vinyl bacteriochlorophyllide hydratase